MQIICHKIQISIDSSDQRQPKDSNTEVVKLIVLFCRGWDFISDFYNFMSEVETIHREKGGSGVLIRSRTRIKPIKSIRKSGPQGQPIFNDPLY